MKFIYRHPKPYGKTIYAITNWIRDSLPITKSFLSSEEKHYVRIDPHDTWSADITLSHIIAPMLRRLKAAKHGSPYVDDEDVPEHLRSTSAKPKENSWDLDELFHARWDWVLDEMIWAMEQIRDGRRSEDKCDDIHAILVYETRIKNGCLLLGKYFQALWE